MKKLFLMMLTCVALFFSCEKEPTTPPHIVPDPVLSVDANEVYLYPAALNVAKDIAFSFKDIEPAAAITAEGGNGVTVSVTLDTEAGTGVASVTAKESFSGEGELTIKIVNDAEHAVSASVNLKLVAVTVSTTKMEFPKEGAVGVFNVVCNVPYEVYSTEPWAKVAKTDDGRWSVTVAANEVKNGKQGKITVKDASGVIIASFPVSQEAATQTPNEISELEAILAIYYKTTTKQSDLDWIEKNKDSLEKLVGASGYMTIGGETHVVSLKLFRDHPGPIPEEIGNLPYLKELTIDGRGTGNFTGTLPESMANLKDLRRLNIWCTEIGGEIPEFLSTLPKLFEISLEDNYFTGNLPLWLATMPELIAVSFNRNCLDGKIDPAILETVWWNRIVEGGSWNGTSLAGWKWGEADLFIGQKEGHRLWI